VNVSRIITVVMLAFVGLMLIIYITPEIETAITAASTDITNTFVIAMLGIAEWLIPIAAIMALFFGLFKLFKGGGRGG